MSRDERGVREGVATRDRPDASRLIGLPKKTTDSIRCISAKRPCCVLQLRVFVRRRG
jgi:hypothetical protein